MSLINVRGFRPPAGWEIHIWMGDPGLLVCPACRERTHVLLRPEGEMPTAKTDVRCDRCMPGLRSVREEAS